jgi:hypothetical protein
MTASVPRCADRIGQPHGVVEQFARVLPTTVDDIACRSIEAYDDAVKSRVPLCLM